MTGRVTAVVLSWNGKEETLECLRSLGEATYPALSVVVVDNDSSDDVGDAVAEGFPQARVIRLPENRGFAGGVNAGLDAALETGADHVLLLNNDATVEPGFLEPLVAAVAAAGGVDVKALLVLPDGGSCNCIPAKTRSGFISRFALAIEAASAASP